MNLLNSYIKNMFSLILFSFFFFSSFFNTHLFAKSLIKPFVAVYKKEQKFSFSRHKVYSNGVIFFNNKKITISEKGKRVGSFLKIYKNKGILKTISGKRISTKKINAKNLNNTLFKILKAKSLSFTIKKRNIIRYYFHDKNFKYAILEKMIKTGHIKRIIYQENDGSISKINIYWFKFL